MNFKELTKFINNIGKTYNIFEKSRICRIYFIEKSEIAFYNLFEKLVGGITMLCIVL